MRGETCGVGADSSPELQFQFILDREVVLAKVLQVDPHAPALQDNRPINEYFVFRHLSEPGYLKKITGQMLGLDRLY